MSVFSSSEANSASLGTEAIRQDLGAHTARGGATAVVAQVTRIVVQVGLTAIMARLLVPSDFGLVAMATALTAFVGLFTDLGLSAATVQRREIDQRMVSSLFYINVAVGVLLMLVCAGTAPVVAWFFGDRRILSVAIALALSIPVSAAGAQHGALLRRAMRWNAIQWAPILGQLTGGAVGVLVAWKANAGYWALVVQAMVAAFTSTAAVWWLCPWRPNPIPHWRHAGSALRFGLHLTGFNFVNYFHRQLDNVLIGWRWGAADLGYYTRAYSLLTLPLTLVSAPIASAVVPALSRLQDDPERWRRAFLKAFGAVTFVSAGLTAVLIATAEPLVLLLYGPQWAKAGRIFALLAISMFAATPMNAMGWIYVSLGQTDRMLRWSLWLAPFLFVAFLWGVRYGATTVALAYSLTICAAMLPCIAYATLRSPVRAATVVRSTLAPTAAAVIAAILARIVGGFGTSAGPVVLCFVRGGLAAGAFAVAVAVLLACDRQSRMWIRSGEPIHYSRRAYNAMRYFFCQ